MVTESLVNKLKSFINPEEKRSELTPRGLDKLRLQLRECAAGLGGREP